MCRLIETDNDKMNDTNNEEHDSINQCCCIQPLFYSSIYFSNLLHYLFIRNELTVLMLGLQGSGKTTIINMLSNQGRNNKHPIYDVNTIPNNNIKHPLKSGKIQIGDEKHIFQFLDFSGQKRLESSWKTYFIKNHSNKIDVIIYVLDISDFIKWDQTKKSFQENLIFLEQEQQRSSRTVDKKIPILIIGNKIDNFNGSASYTDNGCTSSTQMFSHKSILLRKNSKNNMYIISDEPGIVSSSVSALSINSTGTNIIHDERDYYNKIVNYVINEDTMYYLENTGILCKQLGLDIQNRRLYYEDGNAKVIELKSDIDVITISCKDCIKINEVILWLSKLQI